MSRIVGVRPSKPVAFVTSRDFMVEIRSVSFINGILTFSALGILFMM